ncbi:MAG: FAD-binding oxidoreductase [Dehalococcoidia bacterium]|nr:FAD-binding oxidoreductase [Dehalococcoidia bacterium]
MTISTYMSQRKKAPTGFLKEVARVVGVDHVSERESDLIAFSLDYWMYAIGRSQHGELPALPGAVISPASSEEVQAILRCANRYGVPVTPFAGGSGVLGGAIPLNGSVIINLQRMNRLISVDDTSLVAELEAGILGVNLERELNYRGYSMGNIPQSLYCSTLGGWISTRAAGQFSTKYGKIEDMVLGMDVVLPDGSPLHIRPVPRRSVGPSLKDLFLGADGTLGIVTSAVVSVHPLPAATAKQSYVFDSIETALEAVRLILRTDSKPAVIRIFDHEESHGYFDDIGRRVTIIFLSEGDPEFVELQRKVVDRIAEANGGQDWGEVPVYTWLRKRFDIGLGPTAMRLGVVADTIEVTALFKDAAVLYEDMIKSMKAVESSILVSGHFSHFYREGACLYMTFAGLPGDKYQYYKDMWAAAMAATSRNNGSISHHHGIGYWRRQFMQHEMGASGIDMLRKIKSALDPNSILNRGKLIEDGN